MSQDGLIPRKVLTYIESGKVFFQAHPLEGSDSLRLGQSIEVRKGKIVEEIIRDTIFDSTEEASSYSPKARESNTLAETHTFIVAEDRPKNIQSMAKQLEIASTEYGSRHSKYVLFNAAFPKKQKKPSS